MRRRRGLLGSVMSFLLFIILVGLFFAVMRQFNGDFIEAISWLFGMFADMVGRVADKFVEMPGFRKLVS